MNNELAAGLLTYTIIMVIFHFVKDLLLRGHKLTAQQKSKLNKRWLISYVIGVLFLLLLF